MQDSLLKQCTKCSEFKPLTTDFYYRSKNTKCGFESECKQCRLKDNENYRRLPQIREKRINYQRNYDKDTENKVRHQDLYNKRRKVSKQKQIDIAMTSLVNKIVSGKIKTSSTLELRCNFSTKELKEHLESQFTPEMNWDNYGTYWEIDHIIPKNQFNFDSYNDKEFKICWSLLNLRPLEIKHNQERYFDGSDISEELRNKILNQNILEEI